MSLEADFSIIKTDWQHHRDELLVVRTEVFVKEQNVPVEIERDEFDPISIHFLGLKGETPVATARLLPNQKTGRLAVLTQWRKQGIGHLMMKAVIAAAKDRGDLTNSLHAQSRTIGFYQSLGYQKVGEEFQEAGIAHYKMTLAIG